MNDLLLNIDKLHTAELGEFRIKRNLGMDMDVVLYCRDKILDNNCFMYKRGKNWYCDADDIVITINSYSYTIITVHRK